MLPLFAQLLPIDPQVAIDATRRAYEGFERNFVVATVVSLVVSHVAWMVAYSRKSRKLDDVNAAWHQERAASHAASEARYGKLFDRVAVVLDRNVEATQAVVDRAKR